MVRAGIASTGIAVGGLCFFDLMIDFNYKICGRQFLIYGGDLVWDKWIPVAQKGGSPYIRRFASHGPPEKKSKLSFMLYRSQFLYYRSQFLYYRSQFL